MAPSARQVQPFQVRLAPEENAEAERLAQERMLSKNDILRRALNLLVRLENETKAGGRILVERRSNGVPESVELWFL